MSMRSFFDSVVAGDPSLRIADILPTEEGQTNVLSIVGETSRLFHLMRLAIEQGHWSPAHLLAIGFRYDGERDVVTGNLIVVTGDTPELSSVGVSISTLSLAFLKRPDYFYAHLIAAMAEDVNLGAFDKGFERMFDSDTVFRELCNTLFASPTSPQGQRFLHGSVTQVTSLVLVGNPDKRVVVASVRHDPDSYLMLVTPTSGPARYAMVDESAFVCAPFGASRLYGVHVTQIAAYLRRETDALPWCDTLVKGGVIEEVAIVDGEQGKLLFTMNGPMRYVPVDVRFTQEAMEIICEPRFCTPRDEDRHQPPIVRINARGTDGQGFIAHIDPGADDLVTFNTLDRATSTQPSFVRTVTGVTNGEWGVSVDLT